MGLASSFLRFAQRREPFAQRRDQDNGSDAAMPAHGCTALAHACPSPALVVGPDGAVLAENEPFLALGPLRDQARQALLPMAAEAAREAGARRERLRLGSGTAYFDALFTPVDGVVLVQLIDITTDQNLVSALMKSRQMFKDLVRCSSDFSWETDAEGRFIYVSERGLLGLDAGQLNGLKAAELLEEEPEGGNPFTTREPVFEREVWLCVGERRACLLVSAVPVVERGGRPTGGVRGVCRDVTEQRRAARALMNAERRARTESAIADAIRSEADPRHMLDVAAAAVGEALGARYALILRRRDGECFIGGAFGDPPSALQQDLCRRLNDGGRDDEADIHRIAMDDFTAYGVACRFQDRCPGLLAVLMAGDAPPFDGDEKGILLRAAAQLGIALVQIENTEALERLSNTDGLTGLLNRRALMAGLDERCRDGRLMQTGALLYFDLDNFKPINDRLGHAKGDEVLKGFVTALRRSSRRNDLLARLGGDEFAVWLDGADKEGAEAAARRALEATAAMAGEMPELQPALTVSIGVALVCRPGQYRPQDVIDAADRAMYAAKAAGKGCFRFAEPAAGSTAENTDAE